MNVDVNIEICGYFNDEEVPLIPKLSDDDDVEDLEDVPRDVPAVTKKKML